MGKQPVKMKAVVYALSPFQQKVMTGLWKDLPEKIHHKVSENWINATLLLTPVLGTYWYAQHYKEKEKLEHRYHVGYFRLNTARVSDSKPEYLIHDEFWAFPNVLTVAPL